MGKQLSLYITIVIIVIVIVLCSIFVKHYFVLNLGQYNIKKLSSFTIKTEYHDSFYFETFRMDDFPEPRMITKLYQGESKNGEPIVEIDSEWWIAEKGDRLFPLYISNQIHCYRLQVAETQMLIWRFSNGECGYIYYDEIAKVDPGKYKFLYPVVKHLYKNESWQHFMLFSRYLLSLHDKEMYIITKRYAVGQFSKYELTINNNTEYSQDKIIRYAKELLLEFSK